MTTDLTALLAAIVLHPDEDTPRLAYADALMERGEPGDDLRARCIKDSLDATESLPSRASWLSMQSKWYGDVWFPFPMSAKWWRGFVTTVECDAETFLRHADALLWHPGQTAACPTCSGTGWQLIRSGKKDGPGPRPGIRYVIEPPGDLHIGCEGCGGKRQVPRPCPPTAQPIRKVVLTTWPDDVYAFDFVAVDRADSGKGYTSPRWPGVEFEVPGTGTTVGTEVASDDQEYDGVGAPDEQTSYP